MSLLPSLEELDQDGAIRDIDGVTGAPTAFQGAKTKASILAAVEKTGFITG